MSLKKITVGIGVAALAAIGFQSAFAADFNPAPACTNVCPPAPVNQWYLGVGINYSANMDNDFNIHDLFNFNGFGAGRVHFDDSHDVGFNVIVGHQFFKHWGLEGLFEYYGENELNGRITFANTNNVVHIDGKTNDSWLLGLAGTGTLPMNEWLSLFGKVGAGYYDYDAHFRIRNTVPAGTIVNADSSHHGVALLYGAGLSMDFTPEFGARVEYDGYKVSDSNPVRIMMPNRVALNAFYKFS